MSETKTDLLAHLADEMMRADNQDTESAHVEGDELLIKMLRAAAKCCTPAQQADIERGISAFESMAKWYA